MKLWGALLVWLWAMAVLVGRGQRTLWSGAPGDCMLQPHPPSCLPVHLRVVDLQARDFARQMLETVAFMHSLTLVGGGVGGG